MDYTILFAIAIILAIVGIVFGVKYLKNKNLVDEQSLETASQMLGLSVVVLKELNLDNEPQLVSVANIVTVALDVAIDSAKTEDTNELLAQAKENAYKTFALYGLELNDNRKLIVDTLLSMALNQKLVKVEVQK